MSRIDEALRRITGAPAEPRGPSLLKRYSVEKAPKDDEARVSHFVAPGPLFPVETGSPRVSAPTRAPAPPFAMTAPQSDPARPAVPAHEPSEFNAEVESTIENEKLIDVRQFADYALFVAGAVRRHKILAAGIACIVFSLTAAFAAVLPRTYFVETKLLAQRNAVMAALSNPGRAVPWDADAPTRAAAETVLRRDNLIAIINQTNLVQEWTRTRTPVLRVKDAIGDFIRRRKTTDAERLDQLVDLLEARMIVVAGPVGDGTVTIDLFWPNAEMAYRLVESAQQTFLDARQKAETAAINEAIGILERYSGTLHEDINRTMAELQRVQAQKRRAGVSANAGTPSPRRAASAVPSIAAMLPPLPAALPPALGAELDDPELPRLRAAVTAKRQEIASLEEARQRQLSELQTRMSQLTTIYTPSHPTVVALQQSISALSHESPQLTSLKAAMDRLESDYTKRAAAAEELLQEEQLKAELARGAETPPATQEPASRSPREARTAPAAPPTEQPPSNNDEAADFTAIRFRLELNQLQSVLERTDGARIELAVSNAAFKYRYTIIRPAQVPRVPLTPNVRMILVAGLVGGLFLALGAVVAKDLLSNRILEAWQIERQLGLPILAHVGLV